jgi:ElaB/YqjD/DUF883 family membrane-anchored ribosome-binding protein
MKKHKRVVAAHHHEKVTDHAKALIAATEHIADDKIAMARKKLVELIEDAKEGIEYIEEKAVEGAKQVDEFVHENPYQAVGIAIGVGALIGYLIARRK